MEGHTAHLHILDDNGLGYPWFALLVPVEASNTTAPLRVCVDDGFCSTLSGAELGRAGERGPVSEREGSYDIKVLLKAEWHAREVLVLLIYFASIPPRVANVPKAPPDAGHAFWEAVTTSVNEALADQAQNSLRNGLMAPMALATRELPGTRTFALASCLYPCDILDHMPAGGDEQAGPADASLLMLGNILDGRLAPASGSSIPELFVMAGDQVYVDATAGLFDPKSLDDRYRIPYQTLFASRGAQAVFARRGLDIRMLIDDHEISDDWEPADDRPWPQSRADPANSPSTRGIAAYWRYERGTPGGKPPLSPGGKPPLFSSFDHHGLPFFLSDTRTEREDRHARDFTAKRIMSDQQSRDLRDWLLRHRRDPTKFVVSPSILLPRRLAVVGNEDRALHCDSWIGYPASLHDLLQILCDEELKGVVFLSGDEHVSCVAKITITSEDGRRQASLLSVHSSPLYAPYPFANSREEDFAAVDSFKFRGSRGASYECRVQTEFAPPGDGFALLTPAGDRLLVDFYRPGISDEAFRFDCGGRPVTVVRNAPPASRPAHTAPPR